MSKRSVLFALLLLAAFAQATVIADIDYGADPGQQSLGRLVGNQGAQGFNYTTNFSVTEIQVWVRERGSGATGCGGLCVSIEEDVNPADEDEPSMNPIAKGCIPNASITEYAFNNFTMNHTPTLTGGEHYVYRVWTYNGVCAAAEDYYGIGLYTNGTVYDGGNMNTSGSNGTNWNLGLPYEIRSMILGSVNLSLVTINEPLNQTYYSASVDYNFSYQNNILGEAPGFGENESCGYWLNGSLTWLGNQSNGTAITGTLAAPLGHHNFTAFCGNATGANTTETVWFTVAEDPMNFTWANATCPAGYYTGANFSFYTSESPNTTVYSDMSATFTVYNATRDLNANITVNATSAYSALLCVNTTIGSTYYLDSFQEYDAPSYNQRNWFVRNGSFSQTHTLNISLFNANESTTKHTKFVVKDENGLAVSNAYVTAQRYYPSDNSYLGVAMIKTDENGEATSYLVPNEVYYKFNIIEGWEVTASFNSRQVICDPGDTECVVNLQKGGGELTGYWQYADKISSSCGFNASTNISYCSFEDASGAFNYYEYTVLKLGIKNHETVCETNTTASSATLTCNVTGYGDGEYTGSVTGFGSINLINGHDFNVGDLTSLFGTDAAMLGALVGITITFAAAGSAAASLVFGALGLLVGALLGFFVVDAMTIAAALVLAIIIAWKVKD